MHSSALEKRSRQQIDETRWNVCVETSTRPLLYGMTWYLDIVSPEWEGLIWEENGQYLAVMPLPIRRKWGIFKYIHQPLFCQLTGVWTQHQHLVSILLGALPSYFSYIVKLNSWETTPIFKAVPQATHVLDVSSTYPHTYQHYSPDRKLNLKRAKKMDWEIVMSNDVQPMIALFKQNTAHKIQGGVEEWAYTMLEKLYEALSDRGLAVLWYATKNGQIEAATLFTMYQNRIVYLFNTASPTGRIGNARTLMLDAMIQQYAGKPFLLDFESPENESIVKFYESFGATAVPFYQLSYASIWLRFILGNRGK